MFHSSCQDILLIMPNSHSRIEQTVEQPKSKTNQPRSDTCWGTLYTHGPQGLYVRGERDSHCKRTQVFMNIFWPNLKREGDVFFSWALFNFVKSFRMRKEWKSVKTSKSLEEDCLLTDWRTYNVHTTASSRVIFRKQMSRRPSSDAKEDT